MSSKFLPSMRFGEELRPRDKEVMEAFLLWSMENPGQDMVGRTVWEECGLINHMTIDRFYQSVGVLKRSALLEGFSIGKGAHIKLLPDAQQKMEDMAIITSEELQRRRRDKFHYRPPRSRKPSLRAAPPAGGGNGGKVVVVEPRLPTLVAHEPQAAAPSPKRFPQPEPFFAPGKPAPRADVLERLSENLNKALDAVDILKEALPKLSAALSDVDHNLKSYAEIQGIIEDLKRLA